MKIKRIISYLVVTPLYYFAIISYGKKYIKGQYFSRHHFSLGWKWLFKYWYVQKIKGINRNVPFPVPPWVKFGNPNNIIFDVDDMKNFHTTGCYFQGINAKIYIGKGTKIAANCGFITANHVFNDLTKSTEGKDIKIGENCWIGMNSVILPGVNLGNNTIVGAGSIVTKSFPDGHCVIGGNPAKIIKDLYGKNTQ